MAKIPEPAAPAAPPVEATAFHLIRLEIHGIKRIVAVEIEGLGGDEKVVLTGNNEQGKSSVLDAIRLGLTGKGLADPVHHGAGKGEIKYVIRPNVGSDITVERIIKEGNTSGSLRVLQDGKQMQSAQAFLDSLTGFLAFDPAGFARMKDKEQAETLRLALGLDFTALDAEYDRIFKERTDFNRDAKRAREAFELIAPVPLGVPDEEASPTLLSRELLAQQAIITAATTAGAAADKMEKEFNDRRLRIVQLKAELLSLETANTREAALLDQANAKADAASEAAEAARVQIITLQTRMEEITSTNKLVAAKRSRRAKEVEMQEAEAEAGKRTKRLDAIKAEKEEMLKTARCPVEGLEFTDEGITVGGVIFSQLSTGKQVRVAASIAMVANPRLRIILIREGSLINKANMAAICDFAKEQGWQVWIERFQEDPGAEGLHIEAGVITHLDGQRVAKAAALVIEQDEDEAV